MYKAIGVMHCNIWCTSLSLSPYPSTSDPSLTPNNISQVIEVVSQEEWRNVGGILSVPQSILDKIDVECSSHGERMSAVANYIATIMPEMTWATIATILYQWGEVRAVERAKPYLYTVPGGS